MNETKRSEIGSEFWEVPYYDCPDSGLFPEGTNWYCSGRDALRAIIKSIGNLNTVAMPMWCCNSMIEPFLENDVEVRFYPVFFNNKLILEYDNNCDALFVMDYFGYSFDLNIHHKCVIRDMTQSIFSSRYVDADYYFGSLRKWCGVWTGGYAWSKNEIIKAENNNERYIFLRKKAMREKKEYIEGKTNSKTYLNYFDEAENIIEKGEISCADCRDVDLAKRIDVEFIKSRRRNNAAILMQAFPELLIFDSLNENDCPMFVPIIVPDGKRDVLRQYLIEHEIYCPVHWPTEGRTILDSRAKELYDNELSLVCDQRYSETDMQRIVDTIKDFWRGNDN